MIYRISVGWKFSLSLTDLLQVRAREDASSKWQMGLDLAYVES